jgi:hypothetical protein
MKILIHFEAFDHIQKYVIVSSKNASKLILRGHKISSLFSDVHIHILLKAGHASLTHSITKKKKIETICLMTETPPDYH